MRAVSREVADGEPYSASSEAASVTAAPVVAVVTPPVWFGVFWPRRFTGSWKTGLLSKIGFAMASSWTDRALSYKAVTVANALGQGIVPEPSSRRAASAEQRADLHLRTDARLRPAPLGSFPAGFCRPTPHY